MGPSVTSREAMQTLFFLCQMSPVPVQRLFRTFSFKLHVHFWVLHLTLLIPDDSESKGLALGELNSLSLGRRVPGAVSSGDAVGETVTSLNKPRVS